MCEDGRNAHAAHERLLQSRAHRKLPATISIIRKLPAHGSLQIIAPIFGKCRRRAIGIALQVCGVVWEMGRKRTLADVVGDMAGEERPRKSNDVYPTLSATERTRMEPVFPKALKQYQRYLQSRHLVHVPPRRGDLPEDVVDRFAMEGAALAVRSARKDQLTPSFMSTRMKWELLRHLQRTPEGQAFWKTQELTDDVIAQEVAGNTGDGVWRKRGQAGAGGGLVTRNDAERLWTPPEPEIVNRTHLSQQPSVVKKQILHAVTKRRGKPRRASARTLAKLLPKRDGHRYTTRQVHRLVKRTKADCEYTAKTGNVRDRQLARAISGCIADTSHREALRLHLTHGMSYRQLAGRYGVSPQAIGKWIKKDQSTLEAYLRAHNHQDLLKTLRPQ